jgi:hypothetical protein
LGYGPAKAALIHLAETLYLDLAPSAAWACQHHQPRLRRATPMTAQSTTSDMPALQTPEQAARPAILEGYASGDFEIHFPKRFTRVVKLLRHLPARRLFLRWCKRGTKL